MQSFWRKFCWLHIWL